MIDRDDYSSKIKTVMEREHFNLAFMERELGVTFNTLMRIIEPDKNINWSNKTIQKVKLFLRKYNGDTK